MLLEDYSSRNHLTVHGFSQKYRAAIGLQGIAVYKLVYRYQAQFGLAHPAQETLADELGCCRETVNRAIGRLVAEGLLQKQMMIVQGRQVVVYQPLIELCDFLAQGSDSFAQGCDSASHPCARAERADSERNAKLPALPCDRPSQECEAASQGCAAQSQGCDRLSHDQEKDDQDLYQDQKIDLQILAEQFAEQHGRKLSSDERTVFAEILHDGSHIAARVLDRLRGKSWHSPNYIRAVWQDCRQAPPEAASAPNMTARRRRSVPPEYTDIILR